MGTVHGRPGGDAELFPASLAVPELVFGHVGGFSDDAAVITLRSVRPTGALEPPTGVFLVGKQPVEFMERHRG